MRRRRLKKLVKRLHELRQQKLTRDQLRSRSATEAPQQPGGWISDEGVARSPDSLLKLELPTSAENSSESPLVSL